MNYAGFWARFAAALIDGVILGVIVWPLGFFIDFESTFGTITRFVVWWLYYAGQESSSKQATLGKTVLGIKVTDLEGNRIGFGRATVRQFGKILSALILFIGLLMIDFTARKQGLHDIIAGCLVVKRS